VVWFEELVGGGEARLKTEQKTQHQHQQQQQQVPSNSTTTAKQPRSKRQPHTAQRAQHSDSNSNSTAQLAQHALVPRGWQEVVGVAPDGGDLQVEGGEELRGHHP